MARPTEQQPAEQSEITELREEIADLKDHIRVLIDTIDEVREELQWLTRNGLPSSEPLPTTPVLKQMAADPCAEDWGERLVIERGDSSAPDKPQTDSPGDPSQPKLPPGKLFTEPGDQAQLF